MLAYGTTRTVWLVWRYAIKIPSFVEWKLFLCGLLGNMQETQFSKLGWPELCPVLFSVPGGFLIVMQRARPLTREEWFATSSVWLYDFMHKRDYVVPCELKMDSFGWIGDRLVAVDYG